MKREKWIAIVGSRLAKMLFCTLRLRVDDRAQFLVKEPAFPIIVAFWHNRIPAITLGYWRRYSKLRQNVTVLTSPSRDGEILSAVMARFRMDSVRGSSNKRASAALMELESLLREGRGIAVTPDGPRGPKYVLSPGLIYLAQKTGARIMPAHAKYGRCITLKSWDEFRIPLPFSRVDITLGPYETIPPTESEEEFEAQRLRIEKILKNEAH